MWKLVASCRCSLSVRSERSSTMKDEAHPNTNQLSKLHILALSMLGLLLCGSYCLKNDWMVSVCTSLVPRQAYVEFLLLCAWVQSISHLHIVMKMLTHDDCSLRLIFLPASPFPSDLIEYHLTRDSTLRSHHNARAFMDRLMKNFLFLNWVVYLVGGGQQVKTGTEFLSTWLHPSVWTCLSFFLLVVFILLCWLVQRPQSNVIVRRRFIPWIHRLPRSLLFLSCTRAFASNQWSVSSLGGN